MRLRMKQVIAGLLLSGLLAGTGTTVAYAASSSTASTQNSASTSSGSTSSGSTGSSGTSSASGSTGSATTPTGGHCPGMSNSSSG